MNKYVLSICLLIEVFYIIVDAICISSVPKMGLRSGYLCAFVGVDKRKLFQYIDDNEQ